MFLFVIRGSERMGGVVNTSDCRFVFDNYTWSRGESDYSVYNLKPIPSRIPLTALIQGARIPHTSLCSDVS